MLFNTIRAVLALSLAASLPSVAATRETTLPFDVAPDSSPFMPLERNMGDHNRLASRASWYGPGFIGRRTANGEVFTGGEMTAAHRSLPFGTRVRVTNQNTGRSVVVRINDRGPFIAGRSIDLSQEAARQLGMISSGTVPVSLQVLGR
jgi:rare lipoprotein A